MNTDSQKSAQPCGCDEGANYRCAACTRKHEGTYTLSPNEAELMTMAFTQSNVAGIGTYYKTPKRPQLFPESAQGRKDHPIFTGVMMYFPDAIAAVAAVSKAGNDQHNPGQPLHWAREKSTDQMDTATRHMMDHGVGHTKDSDGKYHLAKAAWRTLAELQLTIEKEREGR